MTTNYSEPEPPFKTWFKKEQGRFLKEARLQAGLSVRDVARRTGVDIRLVERGEVNLQARNLVFLLRLYSVPDERFMIWEQYAGAKIRQMIPPKTLH
jgi:transcriptional regulator with XRE-family HTH domain